MTSELNQALCSLRVIFGSYFLCEGKFLIRNQWSEGRIKIYSLYISGFFGHTVSAASTHLCHTKHKTATDAKLKKWVHGQWYGQIEKMAAKPVAWVWSLKSVDGRKETTPSSILHTNCLLIFVLVQTIYFIDCSRQAKLHDPAMGTKAGLEFRSLTAYWLGIIYL